MNRRDLWALLGLALLIGCGESKTKMGMMPKLVGIPYFNSTEKGAVEAAEELGLDLDYDGPTQDRAEDQVKKIDSWIAQGYDIIAVAANDPEVLAPALKRAKDAGIVVLTWDADANAKTSGRSTFVNQAPNEAIASSLIQIMVDGVRAKNQPLAGKYAIVTGSATSPNQNTWIALMRPIIAEKYPEMVLLEPIVPDEDQERAQRLTREALTANSDLKGIWGLTSVALPAAAKAVRDAGKSGQLVVTGLSMPKDMSEYVKDGTVDKVLLWNVPDLGYLTVHVAHELSKGDLPEGTRDFGRLKNIKVEAGQVILGPPLILDKDNIDKYDF